VIITIDTDGTFNSTKVFFNGEEITKTNVEIGDFHLSIHPAGKVKLKLIQKDKETGKLNIISMWADDFKMYDTSTKLIKEGIKK